MFSLRIDKDNDIERERERERERVETNRQTDPKAPKGLCERVKTRYKEREKREKRTKHKFIYFICFLILFGEFNKGCGMQRR